MSGAVRVLRRLIEELALLLAVALVLVAIVGLVWLLADHGLLDATLPLTGSHREAAFPAQPTV